MVENLLPLMKKALQNILDFQNGKFTDPSTPEYYGVEAGPDGKWKSYAGSFANTDWFKRVL